MEMVYFLYLPDEDDWLEFEFDEEKSRANKVKHGIGFVEAQRLWLDEERGESSARGGAERRFLIIGVIAGRHWTAVITYRGSAIRIISVRRSRRDEVRKHGR